jgi:SOS response regulatory protein OraA/RecX
MMADDALKRLLNKAGRLLARRPCSRGELASRLLKTDDPATVGLALQRLEELNLLNDPEYAYNFASRRIRAGNWGPARVRQALIERHVASDVVESAIERAYGSAGEEAVLEAYLNSCWRSRRPPSDVPGIRKLVAHLRRRGFQEESIRRLLRTRVPAAAWHLFESGE